MTDHGQQHDQGDLLDVLPGCPEEVWDGPYQYRCAMGTKGVCHRHGTFTPARRCTAEPRCGRPTGHGGRCVPIPPAPEPRGQGETVRAAQEAAVRDVMGWAVNPDDPYEPNIAALAAEVVDAVNAAGGFCGQTSGPLPIGGREALCTMPAGHAGLWHGDNNGTRWAPRTGLVEQAEARGYATAVANLRNDERYEGWWRQTAHPSAYQYATSGYKAARLHSADYLEAVGPQRGGPAERLAEAARNAPTCEWTGTSRLSFAAVADANVGECGPQAVCDHKEASSE